MGIWQLIYLAMIFMSLGVYLVNHGKPRDGEYNFGKAVISSAIQLGILWAGGFFG